MKILITRKLPGNIESKLIEQGYDVKVFNQDEPAPVEFLLKHGENADAIISMLSDQFDSNLIDKLNKCKIIANYAVGYNNINVEAAKKKNIIVTNTPDILTHATADVAVALILSCARNIIEGDKFVRDGKFVGWKPQLLLGIELKNSIAGIVGAGRIGQETAKRLKAFGMKIIYYSKSRKENFENETGARKVSLEKLMQTSDVISIHLPLNDSTYHLVNEERLSLMKPTAVFINTARGEVVDEKGLIKMLKQKKIFSAGFDVYENEPEINKELLKLKNVVLLPHIGSATFTTRIRMANLAADNVINVLKGKKPKTPVW
ncbi:MAG: D-glycerate dehydrogenase [bacterium]